MPKGLPQSAKDNLEKCRSAAIAAVDAYNRPGPRFRTAQYLVLIVMAWTAFFHAVFYRRNRKPWYRSRTSGTGRGVRYQKIDGEPRHWDLSECLSQYFRGQNPAERKNLEFLLGLRNKVEHRHLPALDAALYGECQAALMNLEDYLVKEFGARYGLAESLAVSLQFSRVFPTEKRKASKALASAAKSVVEYVEKFRGGLPEQILNSIGYSYSVYLVPKVANRASAADAAIEFVKVDEASAEELERLRNLNVLIKEKHIPIANLDVMKAGDVVKEVTDKLPFLFNMHHHTMAWRHYAVRPSGSSTKPESTDPSFCIFDRAHKDYLYRRAWVDKLVRDLSDAEMFQRVTGQVPKLRDSYAHQATGKVDPVRRTGREPTP